MCIKIQFKTYSFTNETRLETLPSRYQSRQNFNIFSRQDQGHDTESQGKTKTRYKFFKIRLKTSRL